MYAQFKAISMEYTEKGNLLSDEELKGKKYNLYGVINHYGSINSGHYTSIIKYWSEQK